jgi:16S rRNA G966 N2-methylase RsmD
MKGVNGEVVPKASALTQPLRVGAFTLATNGLAVEGEPTLDEWQEAGKFLRYAEGAVHWWVGDWLNYGERVYGKKYTEAEEVTGFDYQTVRDDKWVAGAVELSLRKDNLSHSHHKAVAALEPPEQQHFLELAEEQDWSWAKLRDAVKEHQKEKKRAESAEAGRNAGLPSGARVLTGDFDVILPMLLSGEEIDGTTLPPDSVDLIFTDPPYDQDSLPLYGRLAEHAARLLKPGGSLVAYAPHYALPQLLADMERHLRYWWLLALKHEGASARLPGKWVFVGWKPLVWFVKGGRASNDYVSDLLPSAPPDKELHDWEQGLVEAEYVIGQLTPPGGTVLDPMCGSGTTLHAALNLVRVAVGVERDPNRADVARGRIADAFARSAEPSP